MRGVGLQVAAAVAGAARSGDDDLRGVALGAGGGGDGQAWWAGDGEVRPGLPPNVTAGAGEAGAADGDRGAALAGAMRRRDRRDLRARRLVVGELSLSRGTRRRTPFSTQTLTSTVPAGSAGRVAVHAVEEGRRGRACQHVCRKRSGGDPHLAPRREPAGNQSRRSSRTLPGGAGAGRDPGDCEDLDRVAICRHMRARSPGRCCRLRLPLGADPGDYRCPEPGGHVVAEGRRGTATVAAGGYASRCCRR